ELDGDFTPLVRGGHGVLDFELGVEDPAVVELVTEVEDRAQDVHLAAEIRGLAVLAFAVEVLVEELAVPADRNALLSVDLRRRGTDAVPDVLAPGRGRRRFGQLKLLDLAGEDLDLALDLLQPLGIRAGRRPRGGELGPRFGEELLEPLDALLERLARLLGPGRDG